MKHRRLRIRTWIACTSFVLIAGCAAQSFREGKNDLAEGKTAKGLHELQQAVQQDPDNKDYQFYLLRQRDVEINRLLRQAENNLIYGQFDAAEQGYRYVLSIDTGNARATQGLNEVAAGRRHKRWAEEADTLIKQGKWDEASAKVRAILTENPNHLAALALQKKIQAVSNASEGYPMALAAALRRPATVEFRDANLKAIFEVLFQTAGVNFILDKSVPPNLTATIFLKNTSIADAIRFLLVTNNLAEKVLNEHTVLIYPATEEKNKIYQDLQVRTFYLTNIDAKEAMTAVQKMTKTDSLYIDETRNILIMRGTPESIHLADKIIACLDVPEPEVVLDVAVMEVSRNRLTDLGIQYPDQVGLSLKGAAGIPGMLTLPELRSHNAGLASITISDPALAANFKEQTGDTELLANPRIRVKSREKADIHIGDKVPVVTSTTTSTGFITQSVNYLDVGLKLEVKPRVYLDDEVGIKIGLEVSSIAQQISIPGGGIAYQIGTRNADTVLRLRDGETQVLAGLINDQDQKTINGIPGIDRFPLLGRLFSDHNDNKTKTEIVLLITPHIVRNISRPEMQQSEFLSGTEASVGAPPLTLPIAGTIANPAQPNPAGPGPAAPASALENTAANPASQVLQGGLIVPPQVSLGKPFNVEVSLAGNKDLKSAECTIAYDPNRLEVVDVDPAASLNDKGEYVLKPNNDAKLGRLLVTASSKSKGIHAGMLATVHFKVKGSQPGSTPVRLEALSAKDMTGKPTAVGHPMTYNVNFSK